MTDLDAPAGRPLQIGDWCLDPMSHRLSRAGESRRLPKRLVLLLQALAARPGATLTRDELLDRVWRRRSVADEVLSRSIAELRQALQDDARAPRYIETIPKSGYRLIAAVGIADPPADCTSVAPPSATAADDPTPSTRLASRARPALLALSVGSLLVLAWWLGGAPADRADSGLWTAAAMAAEQPFLSEPEWTLQPRFSRDGRWLVHLRRSPDDARREILYGPADGGATRAIDGGPGLVSGPLLSPDGTALALLARIDGRCEVRLLDLPAGVPRRIADCDPRHGDELEWTANGALIFTAPPGDGGGSGLVRVEPDSGALTVLTRPRTSDIADRLPRLAADGRLAFVRGATQAQTVWLLERGRERELLGDRNRVPGLAWEADGRQLLVASNAPGFPALLAVDPGDGTTQVLGGRGAGALDIAADGTLLMEQRRYDANLWLLSATEPARRLTASTRYDAMPALSPDGRQLAYVSNRDGPSSIWLLQLVDGSERRLALPKAAVWTRPTWTRDGRSLLLTRYDEAGRTGITRLELDSGRIETVGPEDAFAGVEPGDGSLLYILHGTDGSRLWRQAPGAAPVAIDATSAVGEFRVSGDWLAWQALGQPGLFVMSLAAGGAPRQVLAELDAGEPTIWQLADNGLVYLDRRTTPARLWRLDPASGERTPWLDAPGRSIGPMLALDPLRDRVVLGRIDRLEVDLLRVPAPR